MAVATVVKCRPWAAACFGQCVPSPVLYSLHLPRSISNLLHYFYIGTRAEVSVYIWWLTAPREMSCPWQGALGTKCPGQNPMASTWEARAAPRVASRILRPLAHPASPAYDMLQFDGFEPCAWNRKKHTVSKGNQASSSLQEGTSSTQVPRAVCSAVMLLLPQAGLPSW